MIRRNPLCLSFSELLQRLTFTVYMHSETVHKGNESTQDWGRVYMNHRVTLIHPIFPHFVPHPDKSLNIIFHINSVFVFHLFMLLDSCTINISLTLLCFILYPLSCRFRHGRESTIRKDTSSWTCYSWPRERIPAAC